MSSRTQRISPDEWKKWKDVVLNLYCQKDYTLQKVKDVMKKDHDFDASTSQYEKQIRDWRICKNICRKDWQALFGIIDNLDSQKNPRILISGKPVSPARLERERRASKKMNYRNSDRRAQGRLADLKNVMIEVQGDDENSTLHLSPSDFVRHVQNEAHRQSSSLNISMVDGPRLGPNVQQESHGQVSGEIVVLDTATGLQPDPWHALDINVPTEFTLGEENWPVPFDASQLNLSMTFNEQVPQSELSSLYDLNRWSPSFESMNWARSPSPLSSPLPSRLSINSSLNNILATLPFRHFMEDLRLQGNNTLNPSFSSNRTMSSTMRSPFREFQEDIKSCLAEKNGELSGKGLSDPTDATYLMSFLRSQLPNIGAYNSGESLMTEDEMLQVKLNEMLLFLTANNFMGIEGIPILKTLRRFGNIHLLLETNHSHLTKSLAENLFRAAIEDQDKDALKYLVTIPSIDINSIICTVDGQKYTPIERAANLQDLKMVKMLLDEKADVRKTYESDPSRQGPLAKLVNSLANWSSNRTQMVTANTIEIAKLLLQNAAELHPEVVGHAFQLRNSHGLVYVLVSKVSDSDHATYIRRGFLSLIAMHLDDWQATQATKNIIMACERSECQRCKKDHEGKLDWALIQAAKYGRLKLVKLLQLYSKTPHRALSAALRAHSHEIIDIILSLKPDINAPAHSIDIEIWPPPSSTTSDSTTSYAEAIEARNEERILEMEKEGALELLNEGGRFEPAITAASRINDIVCVKKLLDHCPSLEPSHMTSALLCAAGQDDEGIFEALIAAGADVNMSRRTPGSPDPLFLAVHRKKSSMVKAILDADLYITRSWEIYYHKGERSTIIEQALQWGDREIIQDLLSTFSGTVINSGNFQLILNSVDAAQLDYFLECGLFSTSALTELLKIGLDQGDAKLVQQLVERGADPTDSRVLATCLAKCPTKVWERMAFRRGNRAILGFGTQALVDAILSGQTGLASVRLLLGTGFVDAKPLGRANYTPLGHAINIVRKGHHADFEVIKRLLSYDCDPNSIVHQNRYIKQTALLEAIETKSKELVELLIEEGAEVNREAKLGLKRTPLQKAVEENSLEIVTLLLDRKADPNAKPAHRGGATAFQLAAIRGNYIIAAKLLEWGANPHAPPAAINGRWPLEGAAENGRLEMIYFLWGLDGGCFDVERCQKAKELAEGNGYMACKSAIEELSQKMVAPSLTEGRTLLVL